MSENSLEAPDKETFNFFNKLSVAKKWSADFYKKTLKSGENVFKQVGESVNVKEILSEIVHEFNSNQKQFAQQQMDQTEQQKQQHQQEQYHQQASFGFFPICTSDTGIILPPWHPDLTGITDSTVTNSLRDRVLSLTAHPNNFLIPPAELVDSDTKFIMPDNLIALAQLLMKLDPRLDQIRYELVPKKISEDLFWRNYLARISFIQQTVKLSALVNPVVEDDSSNDNTTNSVTSRLNTNSSTNANLTAVSNRVAVARSGDSAGTRVNSAKAESSPSMTSTMNNSNSSDTDFICINSVEHVEQQQRADNENDEDDDDTFFEKELAKEVDELVLNASAISTNKNAVGDHGADAYDDDELVAELEMEILAEVNQLRSAQK